MTIMTRLALAALLTAVAAQGWSGALSRISSPVTISETAIARTSSVTPSVPNHG